MYFTLQGAADATGKAKTTIQRAIKAGKLSANRNENGSYAIDAAELSRVYVLRDMGSDTAGAGWASQSRIPVERFARIRGCEGRVSATQVLALHISCPDLNMDKLKYSIYFILIIPLFFI
jgi:hypothetical protein